MRNIPKKSIIGIVGDQEN